MDYELTFDLDVEGDHLTEAGLGGDVAMMLDDCSWYPVDGQDTSYETSDSKVVVSDVTSVSATANVTCTVSHVEGPELDADALRSFFSEEIPNSEVDEDGKVEIIECRIISLEPK